ncbi:MAG TPA: transcriptional repressor LexA [Verrucomicrobiota bacterium]|nr:transcriptional repressor LexA [Verrucomicrobiota bacterium]
MKELTTKQQQILDFIQQVQQTEGVSPSFREIAAHFGFSSLSTVADHIRLLRKKGVITDSGGKKRSLRVATHIENLRKPIVDIPLFGTIPAGFPRERLQEARGCVSIDIETLGVKPTQRTFALEVRGDSMIGRHILEGDVAILEHGLIPRTGDVVAALIDNESTLKTFVIENGAPCLKSENPKYPKLIPANELVIQGVMVALIRKMR